MHHPASPYRPRTSLIRCAMSILLCGWLLLIGANTAYGHAALVASSPEEGAILDTAPSVIMLSFNEPVGPIAFKLIEPDGNTLTPGPVRSTDQGVFIPLPTATAQGSYLLSWRVASADGHPTGGVLSYALGASSPTPHALTSEPHRLRDAAIWTSRLLLYLCLITSTGAALFRISAHGAPPQDWVRRVIPVGLILLLISLALHGLDALDVSWGGLAQADTWRAAFNTRYAVTLGLSALALASAYRALDSQRLWVQRTAAIASTLLLGIAFASSGHARTAPPLSLAHPAVAVHIIAVTAWLGALIPLTRMLRINADSLNHTLRRFSYWIMPVVALLLLSGVILACLQLNTIDDLWRTSYGRILLAKLTLVALLLGLAALNRYRYTHAVLAGEQTAHQGLRRMIGTELIVAVCILGLVSLWRFTPPPRSLHAGQTSAVMHIPASIETRLTSTQAHATLHYQADTLRIALSTNPAGKTMAAEEVTVTLSNPQAGIEALRREARRTADGSWETVLPPLPQIDGWRIRLDIRVDDFAQTSLEGDITMS